MSDDLLRLDKQICFPIYAASRLITRAYTPHLNKLGLTYPQYLVMLVLWEKDGVSVNALTDRLILNTNTITPLLKRLEAMDLIVRSKDATDERRVIIRLTQAGKQMKRAAKTIPLSVGKGLLKSGEVTEENLIELKSIMNKLIDMMKPVAEKNY